MQTTFTLKQLTDPQVKESEKILRTCVHCGFCNATCPTYQLLGDELDGPRGRIYLIKDMLERDQPANDEVVKHVDRCLSCLACMTTCPSGVNYMHLVDHARAHIEKTYKRPLLDRVTRTVLAKVLPYPMRFRAALFLAMFAKPLAPLFSAFGLKSVAAMLELAPRRVPSNDTVFKVYPAKGAREGRVALLAGCANEALGSPVTLPTNGDRYEAPARSVRSCVFMYSEFSSVMLRAAVNVRTLLNAPSRPGVPPGLPMVKLCGS